MAEVPTNPQLTTVPSQLPSSFPTPTQTQTPLQQEPHSKQGNPFAQEKLRKRLKRNRLGAGISGLVIFIAFIAIYLGSRGGILILDPQSDTSVTLNGRNFTAKNDSRGLFIRTRPGIYRMQITRPNYQAFLTDIRVQPGQTVRIRPIFSLLPKAPVGVSNTVAFVRTTIDQTAVLYLGKSMQTIYRLQIANENQNSITTAPLQGVRDIQWGKDTDVALVEQADGWYLQEIPLYNFVSQTAVKVGGTDISSAVWDPTDSNRIAFIYNPPTGEHSLVYSDKRISELDRKIDVTAIPDPSITWSPDARTILLRARSSDPAQQNLWVYNTVTGSLTQLTQSGHITDDSYSPDSGTILYEQAVSDPQNLTGHTLWQMKSDGSNQRSLGIAGRVSNAAWRDANSFYFPETDKDDLAIYLSDGSKQTLPFSFPANSVIQGMSYLSNSHTLIFYTNSSIYLSNIAL